MCEPIKQQKTKVAKPSLSAEDANLLLVSMTRDELRRVAAILGVPRGRRRYDTERNLRTAIYNGWAQVKFVCQINIPPTSPGARGKPIFYKKLKTYDKARTAFLPSIPHTPFGRLVLMTL